MGRGSPPGRGVLLRVADALLFGLLQGTARVLAALPSRWVLRLGDRVGDVLALVDRRGRRVALQNMQVAFGDGLTEPERRDLLRRSLRGAARSVLLLLHVSPMTPDRFRRWVEIPEEVAAVMRERTAGGRGGVLASAHLGNWELLLGLIDSVPAMPPTMYLAEALTLPALDRFLARHRGTGGGRVAMRKGGARALSRHVRGGGSAALLVDRNVRRIHGGIWVPFFGLPARTSPLPAWLARRNDAALAVGFCLPRADGRYRIWLSPILSDGVRTGDADADVREITRRINRVLEDAIRAHPEAWNWTLKRFKSRPTRELGAYPPYSLWDPDPEPGPPAPPGPAPEGDGAVNARRGTPPPPRDRPS